MAISIKRLGSDRDPDEGLRLGTVRRPPRGVHKEEFATKNYYDVEQERFCHRSLLRELLRARGAVLR